MAKDTTKSTVAAPAPVATETKPAEAKPAGQAVVLPPTKLEQVQGIQPLRSRKNRQTGTRINLWAPLPNGPDGGGTETFVVQCQDHGTVVNSFTTRKAAKATVYLPQHWCKGCEAHVAEIQRKAREAVAESIAAQVKAGEAAKK